MKIWLVHHGGEPTPTDPQQMRLRRMGMLANAAAERGHEVVWWNSTFSHIAKYERYPQSKSVQLDDGIRMNFIHAKPYRRNMSVARLRNHWQLGKGFADWARREDKPDVILSSYPVPEMCEAAVKYGRATNTPVVLDVRDIWPDAIADMAPRWARPAVRLGLHPYKQMGQRSLQGATALCGNTDEFLQWGLQQAGRARTANDRVFPFGYQAIDFTPAQQREIDQFWDSQGIGLDPQVPLLCFFGLLNHQFDMQPVIAAVQEIRKSRPLQLVACGKGETMSQLRRELDDSDGIFFPGWINAEQIWGLMQRATFGLAPYVDSPNFRKNIANKPIEYLAGGLPVLSSLSEGPLDRLLREENCGLSYHGSAEVLQQVLRRVLDTPDCHATMASNASRVFADRFSAETVYGGMVQYLEEVANKAGKSYSSAAA